MYCLRVFRLFYKNYIVYYNVYTTISLVYLLKCMYIPSFILISSCVSVLYAQLCPYHNVWPEAVVLQELQCLQ